MAIVVECYHCHAHLELDDGFRGGVCRCSKCGALLKVPATAGTAETARTRPADPGSSAGDNRPRTPGADADLSNTLSHQSAQRPAAPTNTGSGSFAGSSGRPASPARDPSAVVPQSPIISRKVAPIHPIVKAPHIAPPDTAVKNTALTWAFIGGGALFAAALIVIIIAAFAHHSAPSSAAPSGSSQHGGSPGTPALSTGFLGIRLTGRHIVWSLDGSSANMDSFNLVAGCVKNAVATLKPGQQAKFAIWTPEGLKVIPRQGWLNSSQASNAEHALLNYSPYGSTSALNAMRDTLHLGGDQIIFVTAKVFLSDANLAADVEKARKNGQHIDIVSVNGERKVLQQIAKQSGGQFRFVSVSDLQSALDQ